jgi:hypothetical protein
LEEKGLLETDILTWSFRGLKLWCRTPRSCVMIVCPGSTSEVCGSVNDGFLIKSSGLSGCIVKTLSFLEVIVRSRVWFDRVTR